MSGARSRQIAELNDRFRDTLVNHIIAADIPGTVIISRGITTVSASAYKTIWKLVAEYDEFTPDNDPYGEHDFGSIDLPEVGTVIWKFDYFSDARCKWGSRHPEDRQQSYRALSIMLAEEY